MPHVLVVEDSATQAKALELILTSESFDVTVAPSAARALEHLGKTLVDLVVSDIVMPGMSGYELCRAIKDNARTHAIPVILLTTLNDPLDIIQGLESGADNFITKPYEPELLVARIRTMLTNQTLRREGAPETGIGIYFHGKKFLINSGRAQILDLLVSTFEDIVRTNRELQASQAALREANQELESFSYSVSHDLRAPLRHIDGFSSVLLSDYGDRLDDEAKEHIEEVRGATQRMKGLIDDLLQLAKVSNSEMKRDEVNLSEIAGQVIARLRAASPDRKVRVTIEDGVLGYGDARLIAVILENLLGNAWKFSGKKEGAEVTFGSERKGDALTYFVRDNGAGFDMAYADRLFGTFQRLHASTEFEGTGIGLATVRRIVNRHRGRVWAVGAPDEGATFYFTLE